MGVIGSSVWCGATKDTRLPHFYTTIVIPPTVPGIKKNLTSVMLMNLADIAAVNTASDEKKLKSVELADSVSRSRKVDESANPVSEDETILLDNLLLICKEPESCLGISSRKVGQVLQDWKILIDSIYYPTVKGHRVQMKVRLLELERNPARAILRILRLFNSDRSVSK